MKHLPHLFACLFAIVWFLGQPLPAQEKPDTLPNLLIAPDTWRLEQIPLPLSFAPNLPYQGVESIRFMPGWAKPESREFWTYTFIWFLEEDPQLSQDSLEAHMKYYFDGLAQVVTQEEDSLGSPSIPKTQASFQADSLLKQPSYYQGVLKIFDSFATKAPLTLYTRVKGFYCPNVERHIVWFMFSPQAYSDPIWGEFKKVRFAFPCRN